MWRKSSRSAGTQACLQAARCRAEIVNGVVVSMTAVPPRSGAGEPPATRKVNASLQFPVRGCIVCLGSARCSARHFWNEILRAAERSTRKQ